MKALIGLRSSGLLIALAAVALMGATGNAAAQSADEIIDAHIKAIGGMDAIAKIKTISRTGEVKVGGMMGDMAGTAKQIVIIGKKAYSEMDAGMLTQKSGYNGEVAWSEDGMQGLRKLEGEEINQIRAQTAIDILVAAKMDPEGVGKIEKLDDEDVDEAAHYVLQLTPGDGNPLKIYVNKETHLITRSTLTADNPAMGPMEITLTASDYQEFNGVKLPTKTGTSINDDMITIVLTYTETVINGDVDDSVFEMPGS